MPLPFALTIFFTLLAVILGLLFVIYRLWRQTRREALGLDEIAEDTLKELYHLARGAPQVRANDLIRAAGFQPGRFPHILAELVRRGWVEVAELGRAGEQLRLTGAGEQRALQMIRAHRLWERYLAEKEGLPLVELHAEAQRREHEITPEQADQLEAELGFPRLDPHGDPIPGRDGSLPPLPPGASLDRWPLGQVGRIAHVEDEPPALFSQLSLIGLTPGAQVEVAERTPGRILVWSGRSRLALAPAAAAQVYVTAAAPERLPLSELEIGQAARLAPFDLASLPGVPAALAAIQPGQEIAAVGADPLGDPVFYRLEGQTLPLTRIQANRLLVDAASLRTVPLPRRPWLQEEFQRAQAIFQRYGSAVVIRRALVFFGPAFVVSVGYMDPGNWGTDIEGGARFGYRLLWVILMANLMAILLQILSVKLGIATGKSLPEVCRDHYPRWLSVSLWFTAEIAAMATDLAEFLGGAVGFYLLFHIPLFPAALLTGVIISLILLLESYGFRKVEMVIIGLIAVIGFVYLTEIWLAHPDWPAIGRGLLTPSIPVGATLVMVGIIGATVMPHNLYLHSALIQTRVRPSDSLERKQSIYRLSIIDSAVALNGAFFVNAAILVMSAAVFSGGRIQNYSLESAHQTLTPLLGAFAGVAFAVALLASGLASSTTATMAGQVIMEGFLHHKMNVWLRRAVTMIPSLIVIGMGLDPLRILVLSQVSLSFQLPFAMIPLVLFTGNRRIMGSFANNRLTNLLAWLTTLIILSLNAVLLWQVLGGN